MLSLIIKELTNTFNDLFENAANDFGIKGDEHDLDIVISSIFSDLIDFAITKCNSHPIIIIIIIIIINEKRAIWITVYR